MTEVIEINGNTIIHGDCMKTSVLVHYAEPDFSYIKMGAVITDPPYGIGFKKYDSFDDSPEGYEEFIGKFVSLINRMIDGRPVFIWQSLKNIHRFHEWFPEGHRIFAGCKAFVSFKPGADIQWSWDPIVFWGKFPGEPSVVKKDSFTQRVPNFGGGRRSINHPCPTPGQIAEYIMEISTLPGDMVFDPFMGSGSIGVAALKMGRRYFGVEIDEGYFEEARSRLEPMMSQGQLFE